MARTIWLGDERGHGLWRTGLAFRRGSVLEVTDEGSSGCIVIIFAEPELPASLGNVTLLCLNLGGSSADVWLRRVDEDVVVHVLKRHDGVKVFMLN